jgi:hypothetical protein
VVWALGIVAFDVTLGLSVAEALPLPPFWYMLRIVVALAFGVAVRVRWGATAADVVRRNLHVLRIRDITWLLWVNSVVRRTMWKNNNHY